MRVYPSNGAHKYASMRRNNGNPTSVEYQNASLYLFTKLSGLDQNQTPITGARRSTLRSNRTCWAQYRREWEHDCGLHPRSIWKQLRLLDCSKLPTQATNGLQSHIRSLEHGWRHNAGTDHKSQWIKNW